ncbi:hypothetical protein Q73_03740 [Bacillus coahuilensis m2-6]|uniref:M48 family metallopeptidase n=1 Tax=Bacillus coahuilensis TaxID=408580 RepID=UPI0007501F07|nr:M48 family metalloprotease [Bacillus coahuilensis]KUP09192.1 hypothetical protein Q73_03740 [Bacillus coahuilensis m2-6]
MNQKNLVHQKEETYFIIAIIVSVMAYLFLALSVVGIIILAFILVSSFFVQGIFIGNIRSNGVKITQKQFPDFYKRVEELSGQMGLKRVPDVYVVESSGILNAFATRLFGRHMVVLYSDIFELIKHDNEDELTFVLAHELAHIKRNHTLKSVLLLPANFFPLLGEAYSRGCEYTCDRMAATYIQNSEAAANALTILAIGKELYVNVDREAYIEQLEQEKSFFAWFSEKLSTHPALPKRIDAVEAFMKGTLPRRFKAPMGKILLGLALAMALYIASIIALTAMFYFIGKVVDEEWMAAGLGTEMDFSYEYALSEDPTELEEAFYYDDLDETRRLLEEGQDPAFILDSGETLMHEAIIDEDKRMFLEEYLQFAAPETTNDYGNSLLDYAFQYGTVDTVDVLLSAGIGINDSDDYGYTPLMSAVEYWASEEIIQYLLENGADPTYSGEGQYTPIELAEEYEMYDMVDLLDSYVY